MGLFNKNKHDMKKQLRQNIAANLSSCKTCKYYDRNRSVCVNPRSGIQYVAPHSPRCSHWSIS